MIKNKKVLVTGASGFIGNHLVRELEKNNNEVICLIPPGENISGLKGLKANIIYGDLTRKQSLMEAVKAAAGIDYVFHLAGQLGGNDNDLFYRVNFEGTKNLIEVCREQKVKLERFLFISSTAAVGPSGKHNIYNEETVCRPVSHYGKSKLMAEQYLGSLNGVFPFTIVRLPLVYGPGSHGGLYIFFKLLNKRLSLSVGSGQTNLSYVDDVVEGMIKAAQSPVTIGKTYILGENHIYSMEQIRDIIIKTIGKRPVKIFIPFALLYVVAIFFELAAWATRSRPALTRNELVSYLKYRYWRFDTGKAARDWGFQPRVSLEQGIRTTFKWYKQHNRI
jgi:nucleoside-diphosphate-sugar epimerase